MKKYLLLIVVCFNSIMAFAQDMSDTLVFDLSQQTQAGGYVQFPVYFLSNDSIDAVDFNFKYNTGIFTFNSVIDLTSYLQVTFSENIPQDTTVYSSSFNLQTSAHI